MSETKVYDNLEDLFAIGAFDVDDSMDILEHYGTPRHSGRYPWGSGKKYQRSKNFASTVKELRGKGYSDKEIAQMMNILDDKGNPNATEMKRRYSLAVNAVKAGDTARMVRLKDKGYSDTEIGRIMGVNESTVRSYLDPVRMERRQKDEKLAELLYDELEENGGYLDVGKGVANRLGVSEERMKKALILLEDNGYEVMKLPNEQLGTGHVTQQLVLVRKGTTFGEAMRNRDKIHIPLYYNEDGEIERLEPPTSVDSSRIYIRYNEDGGSEKDGLIELRRGVEDISLKDARYAQVRIAVDGTHYLKGMAMYSDDIPDGYDIVFNTNKHSDTPMINPNDKNNQVLKNLKDTEKWDSGNPFGASIRMDDELILAQRHYIGKDGEKHLSALNIVSEEGNWEKWSKNLASQFLSKQPKDLAEKQLTMAYDERKKEFDDILNVTNPEVKKMLLEQFANECDSAAVHLKAAALPRQQSHVILPFNELKDNEIYAPNYDNGEKVVLVRYPHAGKFESPELIVNNNIPSVRNTLGNAKDAVGINSNVAKILSGADFDGDTVLVIPNNNGRIKTQEPLVGLKDFDHLDIYKYHEGMKVMTKEERGREMGKISNLITDMTLRGASADEIERAVKHSMVVIDAEKHRLDYKQSEIDNDIEGLKKQYQKKENGSYGGASTLISRASADKRIPQVTIDYSGTDPANKGRKVKQGIDIETGEKVYKETGRTYTKKVIDKKTGEVSYVTKPKLTKTTKMAYEKDAKNLMSSQTNPIEMELIYANYANKCKALGNEARKAILISGSQKVNRTAKETYASEVDTLKIKLNDAMKTKPLERKAQDLANVMYKAARDSGNYDKEELKKLKDEKLKVARARVGADKHRIDITENEWKAIQAGAVSANQLREILKYSDMDKVRELATPRKTNAMSTSDVNLAKSMLNSGYTRKEIADRLGVSTTTISKYVG